MPLRFDEPSLLGEWKGDPTIIHQALSQMHSASEGAKNRANERAIAEAKAVKKPSFKISNAEAPFSKDQEQIGVRVNTMLNPDLDDNSKTSLDQQNLQHAALAKAQEKQLKALEQNSNILAQKWQENYVPQKLNSFSSKATNDDDVTTRPQTLGDYAKAQASPEDYINSDGVLTKHINNTKEIAIKDESSREKGLRTDANNFEIHTKFPVKGEPILLSDGTQKIENGVPQFKSTRAKDPSELLEYANSYLESDKDIKRATYVHTYDKNKKLIDDNTESWVKSMENAGQRPSESEIKSYMDGQTEKLAQEYVATKMFKDDKARIDGGTKVSYQQPTEAQQKKSESKRNLRKIGGSSTNVTGNVLTPSKNVKSEYDSRLGKTSDTNRVNSMLFQKDKNGNFTDIDAQTFSLSGDITDETTGEKFKITENEPAVAKNVYPVLEHYNDKNKKWVRTKFDPNHTDKDFEANINHYGQKGIPIRVSMQGDINISTKQNKTGTMMPEEMQELNTLQNVKERDETQNARLGVLEGKLAKELGRTIRVNMEESGILKQVTGFDNMEEVAKGADTPEIKKIAENNIKWKRLAESYNSKTGNKVVTKPTVTRVKGVAVPTNPDKTKDKGKSKADNLGIN